MTKQAFGSMLFGVGLLAAALVLWELLSFRLCAAGIGYHAGVFGALVGPALGGAVAVIIATRQPAATPAALARRAAHLATLGGAFVLAGSIGITWASQQIAVAEGTGTMTHALVGLASLLPGPVLCTAALAVALRPLGAGAGRAWFAVGLGGAVGCLAIPLVMNTLGAPRGTIAVGLVVAAGAAVLARVGDRPRWSLIATLPLVVVALVAGDYGEPWMKVRTDTGRRTHVDAEVWTSQGVVSVSSVSRNKAKLSVDRRASVVMGQRFEPPKKPQLGLADLELELNSSRDPRGPVLVIGSGAGRQVASALAEEHPRVDVVEEDGRPLKAFMLDRYLDVTEGLYTDPRVRLHIGVGRSVIRDLPRDYEHIVVLEQTRFHQAPPRLLALHDRPFTEEAVRSYVSHLRPGGSLLLEVPVDMLLRATKVVAATLPDPAAASEQVLACAHKDVGVVLLINEAVAVPALQKLKKRCKRVSSTVEFPFDEPRSGARGQDELGPALIAKQEHFDALGSVVDDRPFLAGGGGLGGLVPSALRGLRGIAPTPESEPPAAKGEPSAAPEVVRTVDVAAAALLLALVFFALALLWPSGGGGGAPTLLLRAVFPLFGFSLAVAMFVLTDGLVQVLGQTVGAWSLVVPLGLLGVGSGQLWVDTLPPRRAPLVRAARFGLPLALAWLGVMFVVQAEWTSLARGDLWARAGLTLLFSLVTGGLLGFPLGIGLRLMQLPRAEAARSAAPSPAPPAVGWAWALHVCGWGVGGALAAVFAEHVGLRLLWLVAGAGLVAGTTLLWASVRGPKAEAEAELGRAPSVPSV